MRCRQNASTRSPQGRGVRPLAFSALSAKWCFYWMQRRRCRANRTPAARRPYQGKRSRCRAAARFVNPTGGPSSRMAQFSGAKRRLREKLQNHLFNRNRKGGAFEMEQAKVGPKGESRPWGRSRKTADRQLRRRSGLGEPANQPSGNERIKGHGEHGGENEVWQQVEVGVFFVSACNLLRVLRLHCALLSEAAMRPSMI